MPKKDIVELKLFLFSLTEYNEHRFERDGDKPDETKERQEKTRYLGCKKLKMILKFILFHKLFKQSSLL
jgi:hypothetical protein